MRSAAVFPAPVAAARPRPRARSWTRFVRRRTAIVGAAITSVFALAMIAGPWIAPYPPAAVDYNHTLTPPSNAHLLGTDDFGRDILSRLIAATRYSLGMGLVATCLGALLGSAWGIAAAFYGRQFDNISMRIVDIILAFPGFLLAIAIAAALGPGLWNVVLAVGLYSIPTFARLVRGPALSAMGQEFVMAARALGARSGRIMVRHLFPVALPSVLVLTSLRIGTAILIASSLSFLGLGVQPPTPEWGAMLATARDFLGVAPQLVLAPGLTISVAVLGFNLLGDGIRDALDPRLRD
ncbi:MAG TPA: ABC transporter permease [bacterium]|nr:ABC transporter permease [bacterium]